MKITGRELSLEALDGLSELARIEALCVFIRQDERPLKGAAGWVDWRMCGKLSQVLLDGFFEGRCLETLLLPSDGMLQSPRLFAFGCGPTAELTSARLGECLEHAGRTLQRAGLKSVATELPAVPTMSEEARVSSFNEHFGKTFSGEAVWVLAERAVTRLLPAQLPAPGR